MVLIRTVSALKSLTCCQSVISVNQAIIMGNRNVAQNNTSFKMRTTEAETLQPPDSDLKTFLETGLANFVNSVVVITFEKCLCLIR